jgi:hypothetical protein
VKQHIDYFVQYRCVEVSEAVIEIAKDIVFRAIPIDEQAPGTVVSLSSGLAPSGTGPPFDASGAEVLGMSNHIPR